MTEATRKAVHIDRAAINRRIERLEVSADMKSLLAGGDVEDSKMLVKLRDRPE